ncbi:MAG: carboxymuconolactone decarboxylase family protein [Pseudomonadota bacterium]
MIEPRIDLLSLEETAELHKEFGIPPEKAVANLYRVLMRQPKFGVLINDMVEMLLTESSLNPRLRELVIMRIGWLNKGAYEWSHHWRLASQGGVKESDLLAMRDWDSHDHWSPAERALFAATDETLATGTISQGTWDACAEHFPTERELIDVVATIGVWNMVSKVLITLGVPVEDMVESWPPDGKTPA